MASTINASTSAGLVSTADTSGVLQLQTAGTTAVTVDASQNVGIGTSSPANPLNIVKDNTANRGQLSLQTVTASNFAQITFYDRTTLSAQLYQGYGSDKAINISNPLAHGIAFWTNNTEQMRLDASGNLGLGVAPSAWFSNYKVLQISSNGAIFTNTDFFAFGNNFRTDASGTDRYLANGFAQSYRQITSNGQQQWFTAPSGTAGNSFTFTQAMTLDASGNLGLGTTSPSASAILDAQSTTKGVRMPNMTTTQKNAIASPAAGLMVFDTTLAKLCVYSGSAWQTITSV
jgi:hypothetical protein